MERVETHARKSPVKMDRAIMSHRQLEQKLDSVMKSRHKEKLLVCVSSLFEKCFLTNLVFGGVRHGEFPYAAILPSGKFSTK